MYLRLYLSVVLVASVFYSFLFCLQAYETESPRLTPAILMVLQNLRSLSSFSRAKFLNYSLCLLSMYSCCSFSKSFSVLKCPLGILKLVCVDPPLALLWFFMNCENYFCRFFYFSSRSFKLFFINILLSSAAIKSSDTMVA